MKFVFLLSIISAISVAAAKLPPNCIGSKLKTYTPACWSLYNEKEKQEKIMFLAGTYPECTGDGAGYLFRCRIIVATRSNQDSQNPNYENWYPQCRGEKSEPRCDAILKARKRIESIREELGIES